MLASQRRPGRRTTCKPRPSSEYSFLPKYSPTRNASGKLYIVGKGEATRSLWIKPESNEMLKHAGMAAWLLGIAALVGLTIWSGPLAVAHAAASVGWGILLLVLVRSITVSIAGMGWWLLFPPSLRTCVLLRFMREGGNVLLPFAQIGGDLVGARVLTFYGVGGALSGASVIADVLVQATTQFLFACLGLIVLVALGADDTLARLAALGLAIAALMLGGFFMAQRSGGQQTLRWAVRPLTAKGTWGVLGTVDAVYENLSLIYAARARVLAAGAVQLAGWIVGVGETLIALALMGRPIGMAQALVIESLLHAIRGAAFIVPGALGVQEGGLVLLCAIFAIPPEQAIALSLVRRAVDVVLGTPSLLAWQMLEWKRLKSFPLPARGSCTPH